MVQLLFLVAPIILLEQPSAFVTFFSYPSRFQGQPTRQLLAMQFRGTRDESERDKVVADYEHVVDQLIASRKWEEMPTFEDMLPDERMPRAFFKFWSIPMPRISDDR
jgi:hypothetical protein